MGQAKQRGTAAQRQQMAQEMHAAIKERAKDDSRLKAHIYKLGMKKTVQILVQTGVIELPRAEDYL